MGRGSQHQRATLPIAVARPVNARATGWLEEGHLYGSGYVVDGIETPMYVYALPVLAWAPLQPFLLIRSHRGGKTHRIEAGWRDESGFACDNYRGKRVELDETRLRDCGPVEQCAECGSIPCPYCRVTHGRSCTRRRR
jgi:hypothetical protein